MKRIILSILLSCCCRADVIISATQPVGGGLGGTGFGTNAVGYNSFPIGQDFESVVIQAYLATGFGGTRTTFLTTQIGPGTTLANQIASETDSQTVSDFAWMTILNVPHLTAGKYFMTISSTAQVGWGG